MGEKRASLVVVRTREPAPPDGLCTVNDCYVEHYAKGKCRRHYYRARRGVSEEDGRKHGSFKWNQYGERWCNYHQEYHDPSDFGQNIEIADGLKGDCREANRWKGVRHRYGITELQFKEKYDAQNGLCAICLVNEATHIDHDHKCCPGHNDQRRTCGECVRDLLCRQCNVKLHSLENEGWFQMATKYVERHGNKVC